MNKNNSFLLIPKYENYIYYMLNIIFKIPKTEKFNIGNEFKNSIYQTLENILFIEKIEREKRLYYLNIIDTKINYQRILLRIMKDNKWIDEKKYKVAFNLLYEIGKILGGLIKYYAKNIKK